jgi:alpha-L-fucosidase
MKSVKRLFFIAMVWQMTATLSAFSQTPLNQEARMAWWRAARFGMFIHWGPVSLKGTEISWSRGLEVPIEEYDALYKQFNPVHFDADQWVRIAKTAGMRYIIFTAKHHDGFCEWNTRQTDYNIMNAPFGRDVVKELAQACQRQGVRFGVYYSTCDWRHPDFPLTGRAGVVRRPDSDLDAYTRYLKCQVAELLVNYGPLAVLWFDVPQEFDAVRGQGVIDFARTLQPDIIINNRTGARGDYDTPEQSIPPTGFPGLDWETCMTMNGQWAYSATDSNWKSPATLIRNLIETASKGGNYLLNVGPDALGVIPAKSAAHLQKMGEWLKTNGEAIYGAGASPFNFLPWGRATRKGQTIYLHVFDWPKDGKLLVPIANKITGAFLLADRSTKITITPLQGNSRIHLPKSAPDPYASVIGITVAGEIAALPVPTIGKKPIISSVASAGNELFLTDNNPRSQWSAATGVASATIEIDLGESCTIFAFGLDEPWHVWDQIEQKFELSYLQGKRWKPICKGATGGIGLLQGFPAVTAQTFKLVIQNDKTSPVLNEFVLYRAK